MQTRSRLVIVNGGPSSGKTTLATAFRDQRAAAGDFWLSIGIGEVLSKIPRAWKSAGSDRGPFAADGIRFEITQEGATVRVGSVGRRMLRAYQAAVGAAVHVGLNVSVDEVVIDRRSWDDWTRRARWPWRCMGGHSACARGRQVEPMARIRDGHWL
jgi:chloramphenicol 3-O-phosphotransferase